MSAQLPFPSARSCPGTSEKIYTHNALHPVPCSLRDKGELDLGHAVLTVPADRIEVAQSRASPTEMSVSATWRSIGDRRAQIGRRTRHNDCQHSLGWVAAGPLRAGNAETVTSRTHARTRAHEPDEALDDPRTCVLTESILSTPPSNRSPYPPARPRCTDAGSSYRATRFRVRARSIPDLPNYSCCVLSQSFISSSWASMISCASFFAHSLSPYRSSTRAMSIAP